VSGAGPTCSLTDSTAQTSHVSIFAFPDRRMFPDRRIKDRISGPFYLWTGRNILLTLAWPISHAHWTSDTCHLIEPRRMLRPSFRRSKPMPSPQRNERRDFRFPLHLPVLIKTVQRKEMCARSENISLGGILLSSTSLIPEGAAVEITVGVEHLADPGILLNARGKVLRVHSKATGDFSLAIQLEGAFTLPLCESSSTEKKTPLPESRKGAAGGTLLPAWHTET
jgi:hypothetical protein